MPNRSNRHAAAATFDSRGYAHLRAGQPDLAYGYDSIGNDVSYATFDPDGRPFARAAGYAEMRYSYDKHGNVDLISYYDASGRPTRIAP